MLSNDQLIALEQHYFKERYVPRMIGYLRDEGVEEADNRLALHLAKLHDGLARIRIHSPRNTFRFYRLDFRKPEMSQVDSRYFYSIVLNTSIDETARFDVLEKNILGENNSDRWKDLE
jgi:hypothetical protein